MIENTDQLIEAIEQMGRMQRVLESLRQNMLPQNPRNFAIFAEGPLDEIRKLHVEIDEYVRSLGKHSQIMPTISDIVRKLPKPSPDREAYWAALRARPASTWEKMPPMISIPTRGRANSPKLKP